MRGVTPGISDLLYKAFDNNAQCYLRTIGDSQSDSYSCVERPIIWPYYEDCEYVIDRFEIPTLHLKLGIVNKIYKAIKEKFPTIDDWAYDHNILRSDYFEHDFEGNSCDKILNKLDALEAIIPKNLTGYIETLKAFNAVVECCFRRNLKEDYEDAIKN